jgi:hypothetical protein
MMKRRTNVRQYGSKRREQLQRSIEEEMELLRKVREEREEEQDKVETEE